MRRRPATGIWCENGDVESGPDLTAEWWTTSDVAAYLGVKVATVSNYRKRGQMPEPDATVGRTHMWRPKRVVEWHERRPRPGVGGRPVRE
ncbi:helix-turn-helix domain-containing protein [Micromonospora chalcea]|uniref:helix-turn-helix domain-containing protein n=1 Tax=Micromonospora chalcea TaxID=1874 RepID=UPI0033EDFEFE